MSSETPEAKAQVLRSVSMRDLKCHERRRERATPLLPSGFPVSVGRLTVTGQYLTR